MLKGVLKSVGHKSAHDSEREFQVDDIPYSTSFGGLVWKLGSRPVHHRHLRVRTENTVKL